MGCFLACFGSSKGGKRRRQRGKVQPRDNRTSSTRPPQFTVLSEQENFAKPTNLVSDICDKNVAQLSCSARKKVTFDSNVQTYEHFLPDDYDEAAENILEAQDIVKVDAEDTKLGRSQCASEDSSITSSGGSFPPNHRYHNCRDSDDEDCELDYAESDLTDDDSDDGGDEGEDPDENYEGDDEIEGIRAIRTISSDSHSHSHSPGYAHHGSPIVDVNHAKLNVNVRDRSVYAHPVLSPVENLTQWRAVKAKGMMPQKLLKENLSLDQGTRIPVGDAQAFKEVSLSSKPKSNDQKKSAQEVPVDCSLSNWLPSSESTPISKESANGLNYVQFEKSVPQGSSSPKGQEDRPILGALTIDELREFKAKNSPRKSPSRSPDEMPIIGTVGTYWSHPESMGDSSSSTSFKGIPNTTSKYREDKKVTYHTTPFETRLERALNNEADQAYTAHARFV